MLHQVSSPHFLSPVRVSPIVVLVQSMLRVGRQMRGAPLLFCWFTCEEERRESVSWRTRHTKPTHPVNWETFPERVWAPSHPILFPFVGLSGTSVRRRWHSQFWGGHKLDKPQTGLAVAKMAVTAAAYETTSACRSWVQGEGDFEVFSSETISISLPFLTEVFYPGPPRSQN